MKNNKTIYGFAYGKNNISVNVLSNLTRPEFYYQVFPNNINNLLEVLLNDQPDYILGLGVYSGVDKDKLRIETVCKNQFRNDVIDDEFPKSSTFALHNYLKPLNNSKFATGLGNSYCNLLSYKITKLITQRNLNSKYSFIHIPKGFNAQTAVTEVNNLLSNAFYTPE